MGDRAILGIALIPNDSMGTRQTSTGYAGGAGMINLHERLSEFSYGFGVTREVQSQLEGIGLRPTPFMPNLLNEEELGFDVGFKDRGRVVVL